MAHRAHIRPPNGPPRMLAGLGLLLASCGGSAAPAGGPPNLLIVTLDTTRADALGCFGGLEGITPNLDSLADESVLYDNARTVTPLTLPSHASIFTGLYPPRHTLRSNSVEYLPEAADTLAERATASGYQTAAFVSAVVLEEVFGLAQGFETYLQPKRPLSQGSAHFTEFPADHTVANALSWHGQREPERPFLMWVHLFDPHAPYDPPEPFRSRAAGHPQQRYLGEVARMDDAIGTLIEGLDEAGSWDNTLVVVVADHGEGLMENDEVSHGSFVYSTTIRVPLLIRYPDGHRQGERSSEVVSVVDVFPTVLDFAGFGGPKDIDGLSLYQGPVPEDRGVYFETYDSYLAYRWSPLTGWADREGAYVHGSIPRYFAGLRGDGPGLELTGTGAPVVDRYRSSIGALASLSTLPSDAASAVGEDMLAGLRALGYSGIADSTGELPHPLELTGLPDPHARKVEQMQLSNAAILANSGRCNEAIQTLEPILAANPDNFFALDRLANCYVMQGRFQEAIPLLEKMIGRGAPWAGTYFNLGASLVQTGAIERAIDVFQATLEIDPGHVQSLYYLCAQLQAQGKSDEAKPYCDQLRRLQEDG